MLRMTNPLKFFDSEGPIKRFLGVELEISDFDWDKEEELRAVLTKWSCSVVDDGSVHGSNPMEIRTSPARGEAFEQQMREICRVLRSGNAKANKSCGLHMHIDARDLEPNDLIKVATLWSIAEPKFYAKTMKRRLEGGFSNSWRNALPKPDGKSLLTMYNQLQQVIYNNGRYMGMNFSAIDRHGTFENRIHHGTININKILNWARMNDEFMAFAVASDLKSLEKRGNMIKDMFNDIPDYVPPPKKEKKANPELMIEPMDQMRVGTLRQATFTGDGTGAGVRGTGGVPAVRGGEYIGVAGGTALASGRCHAGSSGAVLRSTPGHSYSE